MTKKKPRRRTKTARGAKADAGGNGNGAAGKTQAAALMAAARAYRDNHHWVSLRLEGKSPKCMGEGWQQRTLDDPLPQFKDGDNLGLLLGAPSGGLVRLDPDWLPAPAVTDILFPETTATFERASAPRYGRLFICQEKLGKDKNFTLPKFMKDDDRLPQKSDGKPKLMVYQILTTGQQTMAPPSVHPDNGEPLVWVDRSPPVELGADVLARRAGIEAFLLVVRHFWPARGTRNETAMALTRVLLETFADLDRHERCNIVDDLVEAVAMAGGDEEASRDGKRRAEPQLERMEAGQETMGMPRLLEFLELDAKLAKTFRKWLRLGLVEIPATVSLEDFYAYMPLHDYIFTPTGEHWPGASINARLGGGASAWLDRNRPVEQKTWVPGMPMLIKDRLVNDGGWITREGNNSFNLYRSPTLVPGDASKAGPWLRHVFKVYPGVDGKHIIRWLAHRVQRPEDKINHALVLGSDDHGIGKDTLLEPIKRAVGPWNYHVVSPQDMLGTFRPFLKSVVLLISEVRDLGEFTRYTFYDHMKHIIAVPPDTILVNEKNKGQYYIFNCIGVVYTTNHKTDGLYLLSEDRRHYVAWSERKQTDFAKGYWDKLWGWYDNGGDAHVMAYLMQLDISKFNAKAPPPKTDAFWAIVDANRAPEDAELADVLDELDNPQATTIAKIIAKAPQTMGGGSDLYQWLTNRKNRRAIPHRLEKCGYVPVRCDTNKEGLWIINKKRQVIYGLKTLSRSEQLKAAQQLVAAEEAKKYAFTAYTESLKL
jgi:hypothetical protein